jgi:hypothetical protein
MGHRSNTISSRWAEAICLNHAETYPMPRASCTFWLPVG